MADLSSQDLIAAPAPASGDVKPFSFLRRRLLDVPSLPRPTRVLLAVVLAQFALAGLLLAVPDSVTPQVVTGSSGGALTQVSLVAYLFTEASFAFGWTLLLSAAVRFPPLARLLIAGLALGLLGEAPLTRLAAEVGRQPGPVASELPLRVVQVAALVLLGVWVLAGGFGARPRKITASFTASWRGRLARAVVPLLLIGYFVAELLMASAYAGTPHPGAPPTSAIGIQMQLLPAILAVVVYWGSTDFIEWGQTVGEGLGNSLRRLRVPTLLYVVVALMAALFLADLVRLFPLRQLLPAAGTSLVLFAVVAWLGRLAHIDRTWPRQIPIVALLLGVVFLFLFFQVATTIANPYASASSYRLYTSITVGASLVVLLSGIGLMLRGRHVASAGLRATGLYLALIAALLIALSTPQLAFVFGLPVIPALQPTVPAFKLLVLSGTLLVLLGLALRRQLTPALLQPFTAVLALILGLQVIAWFLLLLQPALSAFSARSVVIAALFFLVAIGWDLLTSGEQVTNGDSPAFPRDARVRLYLGYAVISMATLLYLKAQRSVGTGHAVPLGSQNDLLELYGSIGLGVPLIAYSFLQSLGRWRLAAAARARSAPQDPSALVGTRPSVSGTNTTVDGES
jgi:hypothetical protein